MRWTAKGRRDSEKELTMLEYLGKALQGRGYLTCALDEAKSLGLWKGEEENPRQDK